MTESPLDRLRAKEAKATPGRWKACPSVEFDHFAIYPDTGKAEFPVAKMPDYIRTEVVQANADLIAHSRNLVAALCSPEAVEVVARALLRDSGWNDREIDDFAAISGPTWTHARDKATAALNALAQMGEKAG